MKKTSLTTQIFIGLIFGVIVGLLLQSNIDIAELFQPIGDIYIRLIKMIMIPLVFTSLVMGISSVSDLTKIGRIGFKTVIIFMGTTTSAVIIGLLISSLLTPGSEMNLLPTISNESVESLSFIETIVNIVPDNPFNSIANANMLQTIFFSLILGIGIVKSGEKGKQLKELLNSTFEVVNNITGLIMKFTPIGVFGLIVPVVANNGPSVLLPLSKVIITFYLAVAIHLMITYGLLIKTTTRYSIYEFFKKISPAQLVGFTTCSSAATLPVSLKCAQDGLEMSKEVSGFVLPLGSTINMDGNALYQGITALFVAQAFGIELTLTMKIMVILTGTLASVGAAGVPGAGMIVLSMVLSSVGLPIEGIALVAGIDRVLDMGRTLVNITGDTVAAAIIDNSENK